MDVNKLNQEVVEKLQADGQWDKYNQDVEEGKNGTIPSEKQIAYIISLAKAVGLRVNVAKIDSNVKAASIIDKLKILNRKMNGFSSIKEPRDKMAAFGMVTKLVFKIYLARHRDYRKSKSFWKEVAEFYKQYLENQDMAVKDHYV